MFESALVTRRPRRRASVLVSTGLHAALCGALVVPPAFRVPELGVDPPENLPTIDGRILERADETKPPAADARPHAPRARGPHIGEGSNVRVVTPPGAIGQLPPLLAEGERDDTPETVGSTPREPTGGGGGTDETGGGGDEDAVSANAPGVTPPVPLSTPAPVYPEPARIAHVQGVVILEAVIGRDGLVRDVRVLRGLNPLLDRAASEAVRTWRYSAALVDDRPVAVYLTVTINFRIAH